MDAVKALEPVIAFLNKYKFVILILLLGLVFMIFPSRAGTEKKTAETQPSQAVETASLADELARILSRVEGAGRVEVVLTVAAGEETLYQTDDEITTGQDSGTTQQKTVMTSDTQRGQNGLVRQTIPPVYQGAIVICQGADSPTVRLAIVEAVSNATGLGTDHISVLKMK